MRVALLVAAASSIACGRSGIAQLVPGSSSGVTSVGSSSAGDEFGDEAGTQADDEAEADDGWGEETGVVCPEPQGVRTNFFVESSQPLPPVFDLRCTVQGSFFGWAESQHFLACRAPAGNDVDVSLILEHSFGADPMIFEGSPVVLHYARSTNFYPEEWFSLNFEGGGLIAGGAKGTNLWPGFETGVDFWPLNLDAIGEGCGAQDDECGVFEALSVYAGYDGDVAIVPEGGFGYVGSLTTYAIGVQNARQYLEMWCDDVPDAWFQTLYLGLPEG